METIALTAVSLFLDVVSVVFNLLFFWLPVDPATAAIQDLEFTVGSMQQAIRWLNWFVDVPYAATVLGGFVAVFLLFAAWKIVKVVFGFVHKAVEAVPGE